MLGDRMVISVGKYFVGLNADGSLIAFYNTDININIPENSIEISEMNWKSYFDNGFLKPVWNGQKWIEGLAQVEIDEIKSRPQPVSETEKLKDEITNMQGAIDFIIMNY